MAVSRNAIRPVSLSARSIERGAPYPSVITLKGNVEIKVPVCIATRAGAAQVCDGEMLLQADEAVFHEDTGEIEASGKVKMTPLRGKQ